MTNQPYIEETRLCFGTGGNRFYCIEVNEEKGGWFELVAGWSTLDEALNGAPWHSFQILVIVPLEPVANGGAS